MNKFKYKNGFTLVEMIVVIAIITILAGVLLKVGGRVAQQSKERQTRATIDILDSALEQFAAEGFDYKYDAPGSGYSFDNPPYSDSWIKFPPDCNGFGVGYVEEEISYALTGNTGDVQITGGAFDADNSYAGCGVMYFFLNRQPESREVLKNIDKSVITNKNENNEGIYIQVNNEDPQPFYWVVDAWGEPLRYDYYINDVEYSGYTVDTEECWESRRSFPQVISAGPDGKFDTEEDNITNKN